MEGSGTPKTLVTVFLDGREICRKIHQLNTVAEIPDVCKTSLNCNAECDRLLKFSTDFNEFIDTDINGNVQNLDKYNILFKSIKPNDPRKELAQPSSKDAAGPSGEWEAEQQSTGAVCPGGQLENGQGQIDGAHIFDADSLRALIESKAPSVLNEYDKLGTLSVTSRRLLVKIGVSNLVERKGFYPSNVDKQMLAKSIMEVFPSLKIKLREENEGFEHFYDPVSHCGFIELKLRNLRRTLHDDQRRYRKRRRSSDSSGVIITLEPLAEGEEESIKEWVTVTKRLRPSPENLASIKMGMEKTFTSRRLWITSKSPTVADIFQQYPRFVDLPYLLDEEFGKMYPGKKDLFLRKWEGYIVPKLLKVATLENETSVHPDGEESDESRCFRALQLLTHYLPPTASGRAKGWTRCSVKSALFYILDMKPTGTSIHSLLEASPEAAVGVHQPKLVCLGHPSTTAQYIIVAQNDKVAIPLQDEGLTCAIDKLFKMFWVCNLAYPAQLESVYGFFEYVYDMPVSGGKRSKVVELIAKLQAVYNL